MILFIGEFVRGAIILSLLPLYGLDYWVVGVAVTAHYTTDTVSKLGVGYLVDRFSSRLMVTSGLTLAIVSICLMYYFPIPWLIIVASALLGLGISPVWIACLAMVKDSQRATQMGFLYTLWLAGMGGGPVVINFFLRFGHALSFAILTALLGLGLLFSMRIRRVDSRNLRVIPIRRQFLMLVQKVRRMRLLLPGMILQTLGASMLLPVLPDFATLEIGLDPSQISFLLMAGGICAILALIPMGRLSDRFGKQPFLVIGFCMLGVALLFLAKTETIEFALLWAVVLGIAYSTMLPAWNALLSYYVPENQEGVGWGLLNTVEGIGIALGPSIGGALGSLYAVALPIEIAAFIFLFIGLFYLLVPIDRITMTKRRA
ncbi:MFS transporter [Insulibacter thermoxylanivorax]|uniref:MFS transporter n=1 Tax=Insulibacter thermoxylanivorax TaxID=2749268 RepID=UPI001A9138F1|nr:MFS transporter [Insulibacter thermoxylanivorax]